MPNIMKLLPQKLWWYPGETRNDSCSKIIFCSYSFLLTCLIKALETTYLLETDWHFFCWFVNKHDKFCRTWGYCAQIKYIPS